MRGFVVHLESDPKALGHSKEASKPQTCIGRYSASAGNDLADAALRDANFLCQPVLRDAHGLQKLFEENLARVGIRNFTHDTTRLVVVHNLNVLWTFRRPPKAHAELVIDANAVPSGQIRPL